MQARLRGYLKEKVYAKDTVNDECFAGANKVLEGNARNLRETGLGKRPNRACSLTEEEEDISWDCGLLGDSSPKALLNTMWLLLCQHFGLRGRQENHDMMVEYFTTRKGDYGKNYSTFSESNTKTRGEGLKVCNNLRCLKSLNRKDALSGYLIFIWAKDHLHIGKQVLSTSK